MVWYQYRDRKKAKGPPKLIRVVQMTKQFDNLLAPL